MSDDLIAPGKHQGISVERGERALLDSTRQELHERLETSQSQTRRHALWALLGVSPGAMIPMMGIASEFGAVALVGLSLAVVGVEGWRALKGRAESAEIQKELDQIGDG